jgi:undecaprenyl-diphosphatase
MPTFTEILLLALIQGLTEWLPISSSGHLVVMQNLLELKVDVSLNILLHFATALVILIYFRHEMSDILNAVKKFDWKSEDGRIALLVILGNLPTAIIAFILRGFFIEFLTHLEVVSVAFLFTGFVLAISKRTEGSGNVGVREALVMGMAQGIAFIPGISRSGFTISLGLLLGVEKKKAFKFSFLLALPAFLGAAFMEFFLERDQFLLSQDLMLILFGVFSAMVVGYISLKVLWKTIVKQKFHLFAYYCWIFGFAVLFSLVISKS